MEARALNNSSAPNTNSLAATTNSPATEGTNSTIVDKKKESAKPIEVVFLVDGDKASVLLRFGAWESILQDYLRSGSKEDAQKLERYGIRVFGMRHHSDGFTIEWGGVTISDQEAYDVAAFFTRQPRPDFKAKKGDWPHGGKPADARY